MEKIYIEFKILSACVSKLSEKMNVICTCQYVTIVYQHSTCKKKKLEHFYHRKFTFSLKIQEQKFQ